MLKIIHCFSIIVINFAVPYLWVCQGAGGVVSRIHIDIVFRFNYTPSLFGKNNQIIVLLVDTLFLFIRIRLLVSFQFRYFSVDKFSK